MFFSKLAYDIKGDEFFFSVFKFILLFFFFQVIVFSISLVIFVGSVVALGAIVSAKPLDELGYRGWNGDQNNFKSPYASSLYLGWAITSVIALSVTGVLPIVSWFATYRFSLSSAMCIGVFACRLSFLAHFVYENFNYLMRVLSIFFESVPETTPLFVFMS